MTGQVRERGLIDHGESTQKGKTTKENKS